ncbi:neurogenic locus notch homolog protein 1-like isoform X1 [Dendronephthya gigantea]|uniref:neurogenic locus notch homolog protein 1-like isoform X1 n=1 Tax=Dendronephthya gigantea TaxID=151771 RepID=UPI001068D787|nr:neurogenic locus notch homolog protein 1-like isoform X1 [Dendronephthya gigantea]
MMELIHRTMIWTMLLVLYRVLPLNARVSQSTSGNIIYKANENKWPADSYHNKLERSSKPGKRQMVFSVNGIQHIYENPGKDSAYQGLGNNLGQANFGNPVERETAGSNSMARQFSTSSFAGNVEENLSPTPRSDSPLPERGASYKSNAQMADIHLEMNSAGDIHSLPRDSSQSNNIYNRVVNTNFMPSQEQQTNIQNTLQGMAEHSQSDLLTSDRPDVQESSITPFRAEERLFENTSPENVQRSASLLDSYSQNTENALQGRFNNDLSSLKPRMEKDEPPSETQDPNGTNLPSSDLMEHSFISPQRDPPLAPSTRHIEPVLHPDSGPQVINALGPDNVHIIKKFYPLPVVQKVPRPIPVTVTKPVPYPVHQKSFQFVPRPYPQPFSKPDVHLAYVKLENRANPCKHGGIIVESPGGYNCLCRKAYKGKHCQDRDWCYPFPCRNTGDCIDQGTHYECRCPKGFKGINCEVADKCHNHPCKNDAKCIQLLAEIKCVCSPGYKGKYCQDVDHCHPNPCHHGGKCEELNQAASCTCTSSFKGRRCQVPKTCSLNLCRNGATCLEDKPSNPCLCAPGFSGRHCTEDVCQPNPCQHNGKCYPARNTFNNTWYAACQCRSIYKGDMCEVPNPCASNPSPCVHGICYDAYTNIDQVAIPPEGYTCHCYEGYFGVNCQSKRCDHCDPNARCLDGFKCTCNEGYQGDGQDCRKIPDPCVPNPCENEGFCQAELGTFECKCVPGFKGRTCREKTPCSGVVNPCRNGGTCIDEKNNFRCICTREWKGKDCSQNTTSLCQGERCLNGGTCRVSEDGKSWYCVCKSPHFKPPDCACACPANAHNPTERNLTCNNPEGACECPAGFEHHKGRDVCLDGRTKPPSGKSERSCVPNPCINGGTCVPLSSSKWICQCPVGWSGKTCNIKAPIVKNESCIPNPCENGGLCRVVNGTAVCSCPEGFLPPLCEIKAKSVCSPSPCRNQGRCVIAGESYDCICNQRYTGPNCEVDRCLKCDPVNAWCNLGQCVCKPGFTGNGYQCTFRSSVSPKKANVCILCHPVKAFCMDNTCHCKSGFVGDGYQCTGSHPGTIQYYNPNQQQIPWFKRNKLL